jgi:hypothetical protein
MTKLYTLIFGCTLLLAYSCKTTSKSYEKGNYEETIQRGVKKLQKDPYDYETRDMVQNSYKYLVNQHEDRIRILSNSKNDSRFESIYEEYRQLQSLYDMIHQYPAVAQAVKTTDYSEYVDTYREKSADVHIDKAEKWIDRETKDGYREAYKEFNVAMRYRPEDFDLRKRRDSVYDAALTKVVISPMQNYGGYQYGSSNQIQNFQKDVIRTLSYNMNNEFVKFYSESEARNKNIQPDQVLELNLGRISFGQPVDNKTSKEVTKEVVVKEIVYKPDSVIRQMGTVRANITTTKRTLTSQGDLNVVVRDTKGQTIWNDRFTGEHRWEAELVSYTGDERALTDADKNLVNNSNNFNPPTEDKIMEELLRRIQDDLTSRLRSYYTKYQ